MLYCRCTGVFAGFDDHYHFIVYVYYPVCINISIFNFWYYHARHCTCTQVWHTLEAFCWWIWLKRWSKDSIILHYSDAFFHHPSFPGCVLGAGVSVWAFQVPCRFLWLLPQQVSWYDTHHLTCVLMYVAAGQHVPSILLSISLPLEHCCTAEFAQISRLAVHSDHCWGV